MARHTLVQTYNHTTAPQVFALGAGDDVDTGTMSDCVSVVILYGPAGGRFANAVGQHGGGGIANVNLAAVIATPPAANRALMRAFIVTGHNATREGYESTNNTAIRAAKHALVAAGYRIVTTHSGWSGAIITDTGTITKY